MLTEKNKKIYSAIYDGIKMYKPYVEVPGIKLENRNVGFIYQCVLWDNPFFFAVGEYAMHQAVMVNEEKIKITTLCDPPTEQIYRNRVQDVVNKILDVPGINSMSEFQKEVFIHDFIINNVEYDHTYGNGGRRLEPYTVYGVFVERKAVCEGIAKAVKLLLNLLDVKCIIVTGTVNGKEHAWNIVKLKDFAYNLDVTFDMGMLIHKGSMRYNYFNFRDQDDSGRLKRNTTLMPACTAIEYNYVVKAGGFVSNFDRLVIYMRGCLEKRKKCMYIKNNDNVSGEFKGISKRSFCDIIIKALYEAIRLTGIECKAFLDDTGIMGVFNLEITYYEV